MAHNTARQRALSRALTALVPGAPYSDMEPIRQAASARHLRLLPPAIAAWLAIVAHVRHRHTDYDALLEEGYGREAARHFTTAQINGVLTDWRASRLLDPGAEDLDGLE